MKYLGNPIIVYADLGGKLHIEEMTNKQIVMISPDARDVVVLAAKQRHSGKDCWYEIADLEYKAVSIEEIFKEKKE